MPSLPNIFIVLASINISQQLRLNNLVTAVNGTILCEAAGQIVHQDN